jgi:ribonuclease J
MKLTIHRGTHEIGGSCVELSSNSGGTHIVIDVGMPLVTPEGAPFEWRQYKDLPLKQLIDQKVLPKVEGLYKHQNPSISAILLSHSHQDHYGFLRFAHPNIPLYMSTGTRSLVEISNIFLDTSVNLDRTDTFQMWQPFQVGEFTITPYLMDHSAPDAAAFLIEADGQRLFYTGDFRGHGRKRILLKNLCEKPIPNVDCLVMEGSMIGRDEGQYPDETVLERAIYDVLTKQQSYTFIFCSSQNLDRLVSIYRAVKRTGKTFVIDLYTAFILDKLGSVSSSIPQFDWEEIRVLYAFSHAKKLAQYDKKLLYKYRKSKIVWTEMEAAPKEMVILSKDSYYFRIVLRKLNPPPDAKAIYSMWHGYLERSNLRKSLGAHNIELIEIHTSGHAYVQDLKKLVIALNPRCLVPIHTFYPEQYVDFHNNVVKLEDGECYPL